MKMSEAFPSKYLKGTDIPIGKSVVVTIEMVEMADVSGEDQPPDFKPVVRFVGKDKGLVLNRTNADTLTALFASDESADWHGRQIRIYSTMVTFKGKSMPGLRIDTANAPESGPRAASPPPADPAGPAADAVPPGADEDEDDDIPF